LKAEEGVEEEEAGSVDAAREVVPLRTQLCRLAYLPRNACDKSKIAKKTQTISIEGVANLVVAIIYAMKAEYIRVFE